MSPEPEKAAAAPKSETAAAPAPVPVPFSGGKPERSGLGPSGPGEPYTRMPELPPSGLPRWIYVAAAFLLALAAAAGLLFMRSQAPAPAAQPAAIEAPAVPGPGN